MRTAFINYKLLSNKLKPLNELNVVSTPQLHNGQHPIYPWMDTAHFICIIQMATFIYGQLDAFEYIIWLLSFRFVLLSHFYSFVSCFFLLSKPFPWCFTPISILISLSMSNQCLILINFDKVFTIRFHASGCARWFPLIFHYGNLIWRIYFSWCYCK